MKIGITYSIIPSFSEASSLHLQYDKGEDLRASYWTHFGGMGVDFLGEAPWWISQSNCSGEPDFLNEQTTNLILNLINDLKINPASDFVMGCGGTTYELEFFAGFNKVKFVWWNELPKGWAELGALTAFLDGFLSGKRDESSM